MNQEQLQNFKRDIERICQHYGVLVRRQGEKRDSPRQEAIYFYEMELSAKIQPNGDLIAEVENGKSR